MGIKVSTATKLMKPLIAIITCYRYKDRANAQRQTWLKELTQMEYRFFLGRPPEGTLENHKPLLDEVYLDAPDYYSGLTWKVKEAMHWAVRNGYGPVLKIDDDTLLVPERIRLPETLYEGRVNHSVKKLEPKGWCSGFAYWLAGDALLLVSNTIPPDTGAEDLWVGTLLNKHGIGPVKNEGFIALSMINSALWPSYRDRVVAVCEFPGRAMYEIHKVIRSAPTLEEKLPNPARFGHVIRRTRRRVV